MNADNEKDMPLTIAYLNEKMGTDIKARFAKLDEEYHELVDAIIQEKPKEDIIEELADVNLIVHHIAGLYGYTQSQLLNITMDKITRRETEPEYKRKKPHKPYMCSQCSYAGSKIEDTAICRLSGRLNDIGLCNISNP